MRTSSTYRFTKLFIVTGVALSLAACSMFDALKLSRTTGDQLVQQQTVTDADFQSGDLSVHYVQRPKTPTETNGPQITLVFIHGTPGNWSNFSLQLADNELAAKARMVAIERPGWNRSSFEDYQHLSFAEQGQYLEPLLRQLGQDGPLILVGHSYGASLVVGLSMLYPDIPAATVAIAGDLTPAYREPRWYNRLADTGLVYWLLPNMWKGANDEVLALHDEMAALQANWQQLETPLWVIQGDKDSLVDKRNAEFAKGLATASTVEVLHGEDFGHVVHITHYEMVNQLLSDVIDTVIATLDDTLTRAPTQTENRTRE